MPWMMPAAIVGSSLVGGMLQGNAARGAAETSANAQLASAQLAADAAKFRPVGITTRFGQSQFGFSPEGYLTSAGYTTSPELQAIQNRLMGSATGYDFNQIGNQAQALSPAATSLFGLGQGYLATSPQQAAQDWLTAQQNLLAPSREQNLAGIRNKLFQTGRTGLATGGTTTGMMQSNPELAAYYNSIANQDLQLASQADQYGQQRTQFGAGLFGTGANLLSQIPSLTVAGYSPLQTQLGLAGTIEQLGQTPLDIGAQLGGRSATAGAQAGQALLQGGVGAAKTLQSANQYSPVGSFLSGAGNSLGNAYLNNWFNNSLNKQPGLGQTTDIYGRVVTDPTYGNLDQSSWFQNQGFNPYENPI